MRRQFSVPFAKMRLRNEKVMEKIEFSCEIGVDTRGTV